MLRNARLVMDVKVIMDLRIGSKIHRLERASLWPLDRFTASKSGQIRFTQGIMPVFALSADGCGKRANTFLKYDWCIRPLFQGTEKSERMMKVTGIRPPARRRKAKAEGLFLLLSRFRPCCKRFLDGSGSGKTLCRLFEFSLFSEQGGLQK